MALPKDPFMLLSYINTQLRDNYSSLEELAATLGVNAEDIENSLDGAGFTYDKDLNRFVSKQ